MIDRRRYAISFLGSAAVLASINAAELWQASRYYDTAYTYGFPFVFYRTGGFFIRMNGFRLVNLFLDLVVLFVMSAALSRVLSRFAAKRSNQYRHG